MWEERVKIDPPYDFDRVLDRLSMDPLHHVTMAEREVSIPMRDGDKKPFVVKVKALGTKDAPEFLVSGSGNREAALKETMRIFQWDTSLLDVQTHFRSSNIAGIFQEHDGTPLVLEFGLYECLMKCIIHQQLNLKFAHTLTERFVHTFGEQVDGVWFYPLPEKVAALDYSDLRELQFSGRKSEYVIDTSKLIAEGKINLEELKDLPDEDILKELVKIRGVGPWTVQNLLLFGLGRPNLFPVADIGIQNAMKKHFGLDRKPTLEEMQELSREWDPYLSYASLYLWRSIE
ncbi:DNA-3-methyladenine glycosylase family protein [Metabacillus indicus]|uniref:DNA-3-methyladenine glycosylase family protein n=1 Tax=Metabacillus indicus TaxID=246786 RepID=UPI003CFAFF67